MSLAAGFDSPADRRAYAVVAAGAAGLSYYHAREFFLPFMGAAGAALTPLLLDAVVFWLASASIRQARAGRPLPMLRAGAYGLLALTVAANALGGATAAQRVFLALPAALFGFLVEARTRLALYAHRAEHGNARIRARLWLRHPVRAARAWLWLARQSAPAFDRATAEHDALRAARHAVTLALPGHSRRARQARALVVRELNAGRLPPAAAVAASGLLTRPGVPALHRAALAAALGAAVIAGGAADTVPPAQPDTTPGSTPDARPDGKADASPDTHPDAWPDTAARPSRGSGKAGTAAAVARLRDRHPAMTAARIGQKLGVSERTVRRHLAHRTGPPPPQPELSRGRRPPPPSAAADGGGGQ
ncbi:MAG TPA: HTH domain-containing protein [Streptosporangiaceae bacterium]|nr:HTH domain-containing protein [Streptosporangiaceae bacterium]